MSNKVIPFQPKVVNSTVAPNQIPIEIANDPDPRVKELYMEAYQLVGKNQELRTMSSTRRVAWIQGFMNGCLCYRSKFDKMDERESKLKIELNAMKDMKDHIDEIAEELEKNYDTKAIRSATEKVSTECGTDDVRDEEDTKEST